MELGANKPEDYRCAGCKAPVDPTDARWRMDVDGWSHACLDRHPQAGHCCSERVRRAGSIYEVHETSGAG